MRALAILWILIQKNINFALLSLFKVLEIVDPQVKGNVLETADLVKTWKKATLSADS